MPGRNDKYYIGLNTSYHDSSIALVNHKGEIVFAQATERHTQNKRSLFNVADAYSFIEKIVKQFSISDYEISTNWKEYQSLPGKLLLTAISYDNSSKYSFFNKLVKFISGITYNPLILIYSYTHIANYSLRNFSGYSFRFLLSFKNNIEQKKINNYDHHLCHAYHAYYTSSFLSAIILIIDGSGDNGNSISIYEAKNKNINRLCDSKTRMSLGSFYWVLTYLCKLNIFKGEEWKVMGMAPYGNLNKSLYSDLTSVITIDGLNLKVDKKKWVNFMNHKLDGKLYDHIPLADIAFTGQLIFEELTTKLVKNLYQKYPHQNLIITGGVALNSSSIGKLHYNTPYSNIFVPYAPSDDGCAIGAALINFKKNNPTIPIPQNQKNPYLGSEIEQFELELFIKHSPYKNQTLTYEKLYAEIANQLFNGKIIGWVQGKAEFGPRALGNRSILANPCLPEMKDKINSHVKFREEYRPFAPTIMEEYGDNYFENYYPTPFMERVLQIKKEKQKLIPAVTHIDGSGRVQSINKDLNYHFYHLINEFYKISNVPILLNTSLNVMGKPIVDSVSDIAGIFATSGLDIMVINNTVFYKNQ